MYICALNFNVSLEMSLRLWHPSGLNVTEIVHMFSRSQHLEKKNLIVCVDEYYLSFSSEDLNPVKSLAD